MVEEGGKEYLEQHWVTATCGGKSHVVWEDRLKWEKTAGLGVPYGCQMGERALVSYLGPHQVWLLWSSWKKAGLQSVESHQEQGRLEEMAEDTSGERTQGIMSLYQECWLNPKVMKIG